MKQSIPGEGRARSIPKCDTPHLLWCRATMQTSYWHITQSVRITIQSLLGLNLSCRAIALRLNLHQSSMRREVFQAKLTIKPDWRTARIWRQP